MLGLALAQQLAAAGLRLQQLEVLCEGLEAAVVLSGCCSDAQVRASCSRAMVRD